MSHLSSLFLFASQLKLEHCVCLNSKLFWLCTAALPQFNQSLFCHQLQILIHLFTHSFINLSIPNIGCPSQWFFHFLSTMMQTRFALNLFLHHCSQSMTSLCFPSPKISRICLSLFIHEISIFEHLCVPGVICSVGIQWPMKKERVLSS